LWIAIRYPDASYGRFKNQLAKADRVLSNAAAKNVLKEAPLIHTITAAVMQAYAPFNRLHKNKEFEFSKDRIDALPEVVKRFT
jgi:hypothetical protein